MTANEPLGPAPALPPEPAAPSSAARLSDPERWVDEHGDALFKFALLRLRDPAQAEDMVQEVFLAALKGGKSFEGRSAERSWLVGILKHKILDHHRKASRESSFTDLEFYRDGETEPFEPSGLLRDCWDHHQAPNAWEEPGASLDAEAFWRVFEGCTQKLPRALAQVFLLREMDEVPTDEICRELGITPNNLWVMLHRARAALRRCLETNWFAAEGSVR